MPLQEFWYDDPDLLWAYRNSYLEQEKQRYEINQEMINFQCWLQGYYNHIAIASCLSKNINYLSEPIQLNPKPKSKKEEKQEIAQRIKDNLRKGKVILQQRSETKG